MSEKSTVTVWLCVDHAGDYGVGHTEEEARAQYEESIGDLSDTSGFRLVKVAVSVPLPATAELVGEASEAEPARLVSVA